MYEPLAIRITTEFNVLLTYNFVPVAEIRISILFLAKRSIQDSNLGTAFDGRFISSEVV